MGALTGSTISSSYDMLLKTATTGGITGTLKVIEDGLGIDSALKLSTTVVGVNGSLGVGLDSPEYVIHAQTADDYVGKFESTDAGASIILEDNGSTTDGNRITVTSDVLSVATANVTALTVDSSQNVGIGGTPTSTANYTTLTVNGAAAGGSMVDLECDATRIASFYTNGSTDARIITRTTAPLLLGANLTPSVYITDGGNVGIATDAPSTGTHSSYRNLVIGETTDATSGLSFKATTTGSSAIFFSDGDSPYNRGQLLYDHNDDSLDISTAGVVAVTVDSSGRVIVANMPTSDPGVAGALWSDSGTVKISAG